MPRQGSLAAVLLAIAVFMYFASTIGLGSIITRYANSLRAGAGEAGLMFAIASLVSAVLRIPVGLLADRYGSLIFMALGMVFAACSGVLAASSTTMSQLYIVRAVQGLGIASFIAPSIAAASLLVPTVNETARALSLRSAAISLAIVVSPPIAAWIVDNYGYPEAFTYTALIAAAGFIPLYAIYREVGARSAASTIPVSERGLSRLRREILKRAVLAVVALSFLDGSVFISLQAIPQYEVADRGLPAIVYGWFLAFYGILSFAARLSSYRVMRLIGPVNTMLAGLSLEVSGIGVLLVAEARAPLFYLAAMLYGAGLGLLVPSEQYILLTSVSPWTRNTIASLYAIGVDAGGGVGTIIYSRLADIGGYGAAYTAMLGVEIAAFTLVVLVLFRARNTIVALTSA